MKPKYLKLLIPFLSDIAIGLPLVSQKTKPKTKKSIFHHVFQRNLGFGKVGLNIYKNIYKVSSFLPPRIRLYVKSLEHPSKEIFTNTTTIGFTEV